MIEFRCSSCGHRLQAKPDHAGETTTCEQCQAQTEVPFPPLELPQEVTDGGSVVYRHEPGMRDWEPAIGSDANIELISNHIQEHIGKVDGVLHEIVSDRVHIDIHCVAPTEDRPFHTLVTSGMSDRPMSAPADAQDCRFLELMICLPPDWPMTKEALTDEDNYWPIRWLKLVARFPHEYNTWLFHGHTIPNGDPPEALSDNNDFTGWLLMPPRLAPDLFRELQIDEQRTIHFAAIFPLYDEELELKLENGTEILFERLVNQKVTELVDVTRNNVARSDFGSLG